MPDLLVISKKKKDSALVQQAQILAMKLPDRYDLDYIQRFIASPEMGYPAGLAGVDAEIWGDIHAPKKYEADIVTLSSRKRTDMFTKVLLEKGTQKMFDYAFDRFLLKPSPVHGLLGYEENTLSRITYLITTALASLLPITSIVVLYFNHSIKVRLGVSAIFTVLLSFSLAFFTSARRTEIFALTAALSAVQVVFVQVGSAA